jgi:hypothetical protein
VDDEPAVVNDQTAALEDDQSAFETARGSADRDGNDASVVEDVDDTMITEPTPLKPDMDAANLSEKENRGLPTPSDDGMDEDEL